MAVCLRAGGAVLLSAVLTPKTLALAFGFLADVHCAPLLGRLYREGGDKSAIAARHVSDDTAAYMREHCGIDVGGRSKETTGGTGRT